MAFSDDRLVEQVRRGNDIAFEVVYDRHHRGILSFCRHMLGNRDEAEDAVQQTFISAYNDLVTSERSIKLKAWLYTIARNRCLSVLRARREHAAEEIDVSTAGLADQVQEREDLRDLLADMRDLPHEQRAALVLAELGDLSHSDIGEIIGVEPLKVKSLVFQARSTLIESRDARAIPCSEIREQLATLRGGALRRGPLRKHLKACDGCRAFRDEVRRQRTALAAVLPVVPTLGLKSNALAAVGGGSGGGGAAAAGGLAAGSGGSAGGGIFTAFGTASLATKAAVTVAVGSAAVGGGVALERTFTPPPSNPPATVEQGTDHRSSVADGVAQGPKGVADVLPGAEATANGVARRVRAHGSPATKHHSNTKALEHSRKGEAQTRANSGRHGGASSNVVHGTRPSHPTRENTETGGSSTGTNNSGANGGRRSGQTTTQSDDTSTTTTTSTTPVLPPLPDLHGHSDSAHTPRTPSAGGGSSGTETGTTTTP